MSDAIVLLIALAASLPLVGATAPTASPPRAPEETDPALVRLPPPKTSGAVSIEETLQRRRSVRSFSADPLALADIAQLLWAAQGISGPEGERTPPSAGALYPLEVYLVAGRVEGLPPGVYRYQPRAHDLAKVKAGDVRAEVAAASHGQDWVETAPACLVIAAVPGRTAAKYGSRAPRYVHMEAGAAAENVALQGVALGIGSVFVGAFSDATVRQVLRLGPGEEPFVILPVGRARR